MEDPSSENKINFINFNQDCTSLGVGTKAGYKLFSLNSLDKLEYIYGSNVKDVSIVERLFSSSLLALVSQASPRKLRVCHFKKGTEICNYSYSSTILAVKLNRARLVVCLEESLYIHNIRDMKILHTIRETPPNPRGLSSLSINSDNCFLAYPGSNTTGEVAIFDAFHLTAKLMIPAHDAPLAAMTFNPTGNRLATASERGTVIRIFSVLDGTKLVEFRRGVKRCAIVYSLAFSQDSRYLALSSNTETIHIFEFEEPSEEGLKAHSSNENESGKGSWMGILSKAVSASASYLPAQFTDTLNQSRAIATVTLPGSSHGPNTVAIGTVSRISRLLLASSDGYIYIYNIPNSDHGGECIMVKQHHLDLDFESEDLLSENTEATKSSSPIGVPGKVISTRKPGGDEAAILALTPHESHSPKSYDESPPPLSIHRPEL